MTDKMTRPANATCARAFRTMGSFNVPVVTVEVSGLFLCQTMSNKFLTPGHLGFRIQYKTAPPCPDSEMLKNHFLPYIRAGLRPASHKRYAHDHNAAPQSPNGCPFGLTSFRCEPSTIDRLLRAMPSRFSRVQPFVLDAQAATHKLPVLWRRPGNPDAR